MALGLPDAPGPPEAPILPDAPALAPRRLWDHEPRASVSTQDP